MTEGRVQNLYDRLKEAAVGFRIRPGDRLNEVALAREMAVSRTPLREALNRLVAERLIEFRPGVGFFCRPLDPNTIFELYELRQIIETAAARRACERASDEEIAALRAELDAQGLETAGRTVGEVTACDEAFHLGLARLAGNGELAGELARINERIRFVRWINVAARGATTIEPHWRLMAAIEARDADAAAAIMEAHIAKRLDQVVAVVKEGYSNIYVAGPEELSARVIGARETGS